MMAPDDEFGGIEDVLRSEPVWAQVPADLEQRILGDLRGADRGAIALTGTARRPAARAEGTLRRLPDGPEITLDFTGMPSAESVYRAWLGDGADVRAIGSFRLSGGTGRAVLRPTAAPAGATLAITMHDADEDRRTPNDRILIGALPR